MTASPSGDAAGWNGLCPSGRHGLDYRGQACDLCPAPFAVWRRDASENGAQFLQAVSARHAAEQRAREEYWSSTDPSWRSPAAYRVRDGSTGRTWDVIVDLVHEPSFIAREATEVAMPPATHVLWSGRVLCEDPRLADVPGRWPEAQRWISLRDVADGVQAPEDVCASCWKRVPGLVSGLSLIGAYR